MGAPRNLERRTFLRAGPAPQDHGGDRRGHHRLRLERRHRRRTPPEPVPRLRRLLPPLAHRPRPHGHTLHRCRPGREADQDTGHRRNPYPGAGGHQHRLLGHQGQGPGPVHPPDAGRGAEPHPHLHRRRLLRRGQGPGGTARGGALQRRGDARLGSEDQDRRPQRGRCRRHAPGGGLPQGHRRRHHPDG